MLQHCNPTRQRGPRYRVGLRCCRIAHADLGSFRGSRTKIMARSKDTSNDHDDLFADTRMSFGDHLEELRFRLWRGVVGFIIVLFLSLLMCKPVRYTFSIVPVQILPLSVPRYHT